MTTLTALARALAVERGTAQPICTVRHIHLHDRPLVFVPLTLAGEAVAPLAAMVGDRPDDPRLLVVAEPRNRSQRFAFCAELAEIILPYIQRHTHAEETVPGGPGRETRTRFTNAPQLLVPNPAGITVTRLLGRSTRFRRTDGEHAVPPSVPLLGRWLTFFAEHAERPGSSLLIAVTDALTQHWATGQSAVEDLNLATLLVWIDPPPGVSGAVAAADAENPVRHPPAGPATDPTFDNEVLAPLIETIHTATATGDEQTARRARVVLTETLTDQLHPTWEAMWRAIQLLRRLPPGRHVTTRWDADRDEFTGYVTHLRDGGPPQPRQDTAVAAARRLAQLEWLQERYLAQRAFDDPLVMAEHRMSGDAFLGRVVAAEPDRVIGHGRQRRLRPRVTIATTDPLTAEPGTAVTSPERPNQKARIVSVNPAEGDRTLVTVELSSGMGRALTPVPGTVPQVGETICYATFDDGYRRPPTFPAPEDTPWTHGGPPAPYQPTDEDAQEAWS